MDANKFRIGYSKLVENYQFIEMHLKDIYAILNTDAYVEENAWGHISEFYNNKMEVNDDCLKKIINKVKELEKKNKQPTIDYSIYNRLEEIRMRRNYWCHSCFTDMVFDRKTGVPDKKHINELVKDLRESNELRELLFEIKIHLH